MSKEIRIAEVRMNASRGLVKRTFSGVRPKTITGSQTGGEVNMGCCWQRR
jgi:hypothetical protein